MVAALVVARHDRAHRLSHRVERVHLHEAFLGHRGAHLLVALAELDDEAEQRALGLVADLLRQLVLRLRHLHTTATGEDAAAIQRRAMTGCTATAGIRQAFARDKLLQLEGKYCLESTDPRESEIRAHLRP